MEVAETQKNYLLELTRPIYSVNPNICNYLQMKNKG